MEALVMMTDNLKQFKCDLSPSLNVCSESGERMSPVYERVFDEKTKKTTVQKTKEFDLYEFIQASNSQTDLSMLRQEMLASGQIPSVDDSVIDYTLFPENIHDLQKVVNSADARFNALPDSIKVVFGSTDKFLAALTKGTYEQDIVEYYTKNPQGNPKVNPTEEIKEGDANE